MFGRLVTALILGLPLFLPTSLAQALETALRERTALAWWILPIGLAIALLAALRAPTIEAAWGRLFLLNGLVWLALVPPSLLVRASARREWFQPDIVDDAAARFVMRTVLSGYLPTIALVVAALLIASPILLFRRGGSKET